MWYLTGEQKSWGHIENINHIYIYIVVESAIICKDNLLRLPAELIIHSEESKMLAS